MPKSSTREAFHCIVATSTPMSSSIILSYIMYGEQFTDFKRLFAAISHQIR